MSPRVAKKWVKHQQFMRAPQESDFRLEEEELPEIQDGEFLCEAIVLSVDPYMRLFGHSLPVGTTMMGEQVAKVIESKNGKYPVGCHICILAGWRTHTISDGEDPEARYLPQLGDLPPSLSLGVVGMPGTTAYFGLLEVGCLKEGEVLFVNGAAGLVGSVAGQIAKEKGCTVIGTASTEEKVKWLTEDLHFNEVINYRAGEFDKALKKAAPKGIDVFYDNVGGMMTERVMARMNPGGRVVICGTMASYNDKHGPGSESEGRLPYHHILMKTLTVRGFTMWQYMQRRSEGEKYIVDLIKNDKLKYIEHRVHGFDQMPAAFISMLKGEHMGKTVIFVNSDAAAAATDQQPSLHTPVVPMTLSTS